MKKGAVAMNLYSSQLVLMDPAHLPGGRGMGVVNDVRTGRWELYPRRKDGRLSSVTLLHESAAAHMIGRQTDLSELEDIYGSSFTSETFSVSCDEVLAVVDLAVCLAMPDLVGVESTIDFIRGDKDQDLLKGYVHRDLRRTFEAGHLVRHRGGDTVSGRPSVLRDEDGCAVAIFLYLR